MASFEDWLNSNADWLNNLALSLDQVYRLVTGSAYIIGCAFAFKALYSLKVYGELRTMMASNTSLKEPLTYLIVAAVFIYLPTAVDLFMQSTFDTSQILGYAQLPAGFSFTATNGGYALLKLLQLIGIIAFIRGWVILARSTAQGSQPGGAGKGIIHIFGGVLMMNIVFTINVLYNTLGISF